ALRTRGGPVVALPEIVAGQVGVARQQLIPSVAVDVPLGGEQGLEGGLGRERAALAPMKTHELRDGQRALLAEERLGLGDDVVWLAGELRRDGRRLAQRGDDAAGLLEGVEDLLR